MKKLIALITMSIVINGCAVGTTSKQIAGVYVSDREYQGLSCPELQKELKSVVLREDMLIHAQDQRVTTNMMQAFWVGFGNGDGVEAAELAQIRGHRMALVKQSIMADCEIPKDIDDMIKGFIPIETPNKEPLYQPSRGPEVGYNHIENK